MWHFNVDKLALQLLTFPDLHAKILMPRWQKLLIGMFVPRIFLYLNGTINLTLGQTVTTITQQKYQKQLDTSVLQDLEWSVGKEVELIIVIRC